jgi:hypothetical protein
MRLLRRSHCAARQAGHARGSVRTSIIFSSTLFGILLSPSSPGTGDGEAAAAGSALLRGCAVATSCSSGPPPSDDGLSFAAEGIPTKTTTLGAALLSPHSMSKADS